MKLRFLALLCLSSAWGELTSQETKFLTELSTLIPFSPSTPDWLAQVFSSLAHLAKESRILPESADDQKDSSDDLPLADKDKKALSQWMLDHYKDFLILLSEKLDASKPWVSLLGFPIKYPALSTKPLQPKEPDYQSKEKYEQAQLQWALEYWNWYVSYLTRNAPLQKSNLEDAQRKGKENLFRLISYIRMIAQEGGDHEPLVQELKSYLLEEKERARNALIGFHECMTKVPQVLPSEVLRESFLKLLSANSDPQTQDDIFMQSAPFIRELLQNPNAAPKTLYLVKENGDKYSSTDYEIASHLLEKGYRNFHQKYSDYCEHLNNILLKEVFFPKTTSLKKELLK